MAEDKIRYGPYVPGPLQKHLNEKVFDGESGLYNRLAREKDRLKREQINLDDAISDKQPDEVLNIFRDRVGQHRLVTDMYQRDLDKWRRLLGANDRGFHYLQKYFTNDVSLSQSKQKLISYQILRSIHYAYSADFKLIVSAQNILNDQAKILEKCLPIVKSALGKIDSNLGITLAPVPLETRIKLELYTEIVEGLCRDFPVLIDVQDQYFDAALKIGRASRADYASARLRLALSFIVKYIDVRSDTKSLLSAIKHSIDSVSDKAVAVRDIQRQL